MTTCILEVLASAKYRAILLRFVLSCVEPFCFVLFFFFVLCFYSIIASCILSHCCAIRFDLGGRRYWLVVLNRDVLREEPGRILEFMTWFSHIQSLF